MHGLGVLANRMASLERLFDLDGSVVPQSQPYLMQGLHSVRMEVDTCVTEFTSWKSEQLPLRASSKREEISSFKTLRAWLTSEMFN